MAPKCAVFGCNVGLHVLPANPEVREKWLRFIKYEDRPISHVSGRSIIYICSAHFKPDCFSNLTQKKLGFARNFH